MSIRTNHLTGWLEWRPDIAPAIKAWEKPVYRRAIGWRAMLRRLRRRPIHFMEEGRL